VSVRPGPSDWVFATDSNRTGAKRGGQPLWLFKVMAYHIQPIARKLGIQKRVGWHTFRRTYSSILQGNREEVKVVQELLRHSSTRMTLDVYAGANADQTSGAMESRGDDPGRISVYRGVYREAAAVRSKAQIRFGVPDGIRTGVTAMKGSLAPVFSQCRRT
jgi:hypothetical protein